MRLTIERKSLESLLRGATLAMSRSPIPIMDCVKLDTAAGDLAVTGCNMDQRATLHGIAQIEKTGACAVNAKMLMQIVGGASCKEITLDADSGSVAIRAGGGAYKLPTLPADDFPESRSVKDDAGWYELDGADLLKAIAFCEPATERDGFKRFNLCGVLIEPQKDALRAVATDSGHLHMIDVPATIGGAPPPIIIPNEALAVIKGLSGRSERIKIATDDGLAKVWWGKSLKITTKLIDGTFPEYQRVIPKHNAKAPSILMEPKELADAIRRVSIAASLDNGKWPLITLHVRDGKLIVAAENPHSATEGIESLDVETKGDLPIYGCRAKNLTSILAVLADADTVRLQFGGESEVVRVEVVADETRLCISAPSTVLLPRSLREAA